MLISWWSFMWAGLYPWARMVWEHYPSFPRPFSCHFPNHWIPNWKPNDPNWLSQLIFQNRLKTQIVNFEDFRMRFFGNLLSPVLFQSVADDRCANPRNYLPVSHGVPPMVLAPKWIYIQIYQKKIYILKFYRKKYIFWNFRKKLQKLSIIYIL